ncbi:MAG TPA: S41 family peptidase [Bacillota bacterium]|nr:S41 family peptidase [Bacillota bacterium]
MPKPDLTINRKHIWWIAALVVLLLAATNIAAYRLGLSRGGPSAALAGGEGELVPPDSLDSEWDIFIEVIRRLHEDYLYPVDTAELVRGAVRGAVEAVGDPRTVFFDARELVDFLIQTEGSFYGIGVRIVEVDGDIVVVETIPGSPAEAAGICPGDRICRAGTQELSGLGLERAAELLRGEKGSSVALSIKRPGREEEIHLTLVRDKVEINTVSSRWEKPGLGYIRISNFDRDTGASFAEQLRLLESGGLQGLILDLRDNPGGLVDEAIKVAELILPEGEIARLVGREGEIRQIYHSAAPGKDYPIIVLVNEETASAAEILAGALQDRGAALLVGEKTYGKATVQQPENLSGGNALLLTVARYLTPSGKDIDGKGLEPDVFVETPLFLKYYHYFLPLHLARGDYGTEVELLQEILAEFGYRPGRDGYFDEATAAALRQFQKDAGLAVTGEFDDLTWLRLRQDFEKISRERDPQLRRAVELIGQPALRPRSEEKTN